MLQGLSRCPMYPTSASNSGARRMGARDLQIVSLSYEPRLGVCVWETMVFEGYEGWLTRYYQPSHCGPQGLIAHQEGLKKVQVCKQAPPFFWFRPALDI